MKIEANIRLKMKNDYLVKKLMMITKFKDPNRLFKVKINTLLASEFGHENFLDKCLYWTENEWRLIEMAEYEIKNYFKQYDNKDNFEIILNRIKNINDKGLEIEVELPDKYKK